MDPVRQEAAAFIRALTGAESTHMTFQVIGPHPLVFHGSLDEHWERLADLNRKGHGIFVMINEGDLRGRTEENIVALRALFTDDDGGGRPVPASTKCPPSIVVRSARGCHTYWLLKPGEDRRRFTTSQEDLASHFGTDDKVCDLPRVMRMPGFLHLKDPDRPFLVKVESCSNRLYTISEVTAAFPPYAEPTHDLCYVISLSSYFLRRPDGQWDLLSPLKKDGALKHLRALGVSEATARDIMKRDLMAIAHKIDCVPNADTIFERDGRLVVNSYVPSRIEPAAGGWPRIEEIIGTVTSGDSEAGRWLLNWMAAKYQNPGSHMLTAVVFQGAQGVGKTILGNVFAQLLGEENSASISQADIDGSFNGHFVQKLLVIADEVVNQENLRDTASVLKKYITDERITANLKFMPQFEVRNRMAWWFTSNAITPVRVEGPNDRRYTVFSTMVPPSAKYRAMMNGIHLQSGRFTPEFEVEMAAFAHMLTSLDVDHDLSSRPLLNAAREALIAAGKNSAELFLTEISERGVFEVVDHASRSADGTSRVLSTATWSDPEHKAILVDDLYEGYRRYCEAEGMKPFRKEILGQHVRYVFPLAERRRVSYRGKRHWAYYGLPATNGSLTGVS